MALVKNTLINEADLETNENKEPLTLKVPKFEICISPAEHGKKLYVEDFENRDNEEKTLKKPPKRKLLKDLNSNDVSPAPKKVSKLKRMPKKNLSESIAERFGDMKLKENRSPKETLNTSPNLKATNDREETRREEKALPCRGKTKTLESRVSLPRVKGKSLKLASPREKKTRRTLGILMAYESKSEGENVSPLSEPEKAKKITGKGGRKSTPTAEPNVQNIEKLKRVFPNVDPLFLHSQLSETKNDLEDLIVSLKEREKLGDLPLNESYKKKLESEKIVEKCMQDFTVENFLKSIPDPWNYFLNTEIHNSSRYASHSLHYLKNKHKKHYSQTIQEILARSGYSLYKADKELSNKRKNRMLKMRTTNRSKNECDSGKPDNINFQFLQEVLFIENENEIIEEVKKIESVKSKKLKKAQKAGSLLTCQSCFRSDFLWDNAACCSGVHVFCGKCINRYVEIEMGKGNFSFKCLLKCEEILPLEYIQDVVNPDLMAIIIRRNQLKVMELVGIENIEFCSSCYHLLDSISEEPVLSCLNPCCMKQFCKYCRKSSHFSFDCSEVEDFEMSENKLEIKTDSNFLMCLNCQGEFIKEDNSNKMICSCGIAICTICRQSFSDCQHFISKIDEENSTSNNDLAYQFTQEEADSQKKENFEAPPRLSSFKDSPEFFPDFVTSESGTF